MPSLVSVIIPCHNQGKFLADAIVSVLNQTYPHFECLVINDGSTDQTRDVALTYAKQDSRVRYLEQANKGAASARNLGLDHVQGAYVQFLDADDAISSKKLEIQIGLLAETDNPALAYSDFYYCDEKGIPKTNPSDPFHPPTFVMEEPLWDMVSRWETQLSIPIHCFLFDRRFFMNHNVRFDLNLPTHMDWDCWIQIFSLDPTIKSTNEKLAFYRHTSGSLTKNEKLMWIGYYRVIQKYKKSYKDNVILSNLLDKKLEEGKNRYRPYRWIVPKLAGRVLGKINFQKRRKDVLKLLDVIFDFIMVTRWLKNS